MEPTTIPPNSREFYPAATWWPIPPVPMPANRGVLGDRNTIVTHITEGGPEVKNTLAWYADLKDKPNRFGAHFYIGQDGKVYQTELIGFTTWHASQVNAHAIGIEHAAATGTAPGVPRMDVTEAQYQASSKLIRWLCDIAKIPCDRAHIRTHWEASPADGHKLCCSPTLDPERLVAMAKALAE